MQITRRSPFSDTFNTLEVPCTVEQLEKWKSGALIQEAMPNVPPELREFVMTGITPDEWDATFGAGDPDVYPATPR